ncbi:unnamed protein product [Phytophthora fragariaefolia]|uniref:Unnamed protein product n=1 Tax=Phytophthora fragariaefolia TaxID=1490495 RepID=A0A9W6YC01_9STRA|nr:unnamed protein product [Phytophthora fragariaefolia]
MTATYTGPSNQAAAISSPAPRKRGRPKGSKNKPKPGQLAAKQSRSTEQVSATQNRSTTLRHSLDEVLKEEAASAEVLQFVQGANTELPIYTAESTVLPPTPTTVAHSDNLTVLPNEGLPELAHLIATVTGVTRTVAIRKRNALTWADAGHRCTIVCKKAWPSLSLLIPGTNRLTHSKVRC